MSAADMVCPHCSASMRGDEVPAKYRTHSDDCPLDGGEARCFCLPYGDATHFSRVMGHEVRGVYDGVLFWSCPDCGLAWSRWTEGRLGVAAATHVELYNAGVSL